MEDLEWGIRDAVESDIPFIYKTWSISYRYGSLLCSKGCKNKIFYPNYSRVIDWILNQPDTSISVAVKKDEPNILFGYIVFQTGVAHYCFVKPESRRFGIARSLFTFASPILIYTQKTNILSQILKKNKTLNDCMDYNPFLLFNQYDSGKGKKWQENLEH